MPDLHLHKYTAYGLAIHSEVRLPELQPGTDPADVVIRVDPNLESPDTITPTRVRVFCQPQLSYLAWPFVGIVEVRDGKTITLKPVSDLNPDLLHHVITSVALVHILYQRGLFLLHSSVVAMNGVAVAFSGAKGWGKSTLAAHLHSHGHSLIADDTLAVELSPDGIPFVLPAFPQLKLWPDAVTSLGTTPDELPRLFEGYEKRAKPLETRFIREKLPLSRIYILENTASESLAIEPLPFQEAFQKLTTYSYAAHVSNLHQFDMLAVTNRVTDQFRLIAQIASAIPVCLLKRQLQLSELPELVKLIEEDIKSSSTIVSDTI